MILTVTLNPCLHRVVSFRGDASRRVIRPVDGAFVVGGKGVNVARVAMRMGAKVTALITSGGAVGRLMCAALDEEGVLFDAVPVASETRMSTLVLSRDDASFREYLEPGREVTAGEVAELRARYLRLLESATLVTLNGSVPDPRLDDFHAFAVGEARRRKVPVIVDTYGPPAPLAAAALPDVLKANLEEVRSSFGVDARSLDEVADFARDQLRSGVGAVLITDGAAGAGLWQRGDGRGGDGQGDREHRIIPPPVEEIHPVGCGDAMLGAMVASIGRGDDGEGSCVGEMLEAVRVGAAAGAANASSVAIGDIEPAEVERLRELVRVEGEPRAIARSSSPPPDRPPAHPRSG